MSSIRFNKTGTLRRPTVNSKGQAVVSGNGTSVRCALWRQRLHNIVGNAGEVLQVDAEAFVPAATDVLVRDQLEQGGVTYVVVAVTPADDDLAVLDHVGLQLQRVSG